MDEISKPSIGALTAAAFKVGCLGFGGPAGQIALMQRVFVHEKKWIDQDRFLHALSFCTLLPGPEAQQLATYIGWRLHGVTGGVIAGVLFVAPGALVMLCLSWLYVAHAQAPTIAAVFFGVKAAVLALVADALLRFGRRALATRFDWLIALCAFAALSLFGAPFPVVILAAALLGAGRGDHNGGAVAAQPAQKKVRGALHAALVWGAVWLAPLGAALAVLGPDHLVSRVGVLFSQLAVVSFGGAYTVLAYLQQQAVEAQQWLSAGQMMDGLGLAETTPGPLVLVNQFAGFVAGWQAPEGGGWGLALLAAAMATWCTFAPSFLWIFAGAPFAEDLRANPRAAGALKAIMAAVIGVIASLAFWFAAHSLFTRTGVVATPWGQALSVPDVLSFDPWAAAIALAAGVALIRFKANIVLVLVACAAAGMLRAYAG